MLLWDQEVLEFVKGSEGLMGSAIQNETQESLKRKVSDSVTLEGIEKRKEWEWMSKKIFQRVSLMEKEKRERFLLMINSEMSKEMMKNSETDSQSERKFVYLRPDSWLLRQRGLLLRKR